MTGYQTPNFPKGIFAGINDGPGGGPMEFSPESKAWLEGSKAWLRAKQAAAVATAAQNNGGEPAWAEAAAPVAAG